MDTVAIKKALAADTIETGGFTLSPYTLEKIKIASLKRGIIILTDPDGAGERIRKFLTERFPNAGQAFIPKVEATAHNDVGIEQASPEAICMALSKVRYHECEERNEFTGQDLLTNALSGSAKAVSRRDKIGFLLGIGYANAKQFVKRLNNYGVTREEFLRAVQSLED